MSGPSKPLMAQTALDDQGVLDLGKNCQLCNQIDFLPFYCEFCDNIYCAQHRNVDVHHCKRPERKYTAGPLQGPSATSFFPDPKKRQEALNELFEKVALRLAKAIAKQEETKIMPLAKLKKFLQIQKKSCEKSFKTSIFKKTRLLKPSSPLVELAALKEVAKGAANVQAADRIYVWSLFINLNEEDLNQISEDDKVGIWLLRNWSLGRSLDSIANQMKIMNYNNSTLHTSKRLSLFRVVNNEPTLLDLTKKNLGSFSNGDTLYLVQG